jgi:HrpA-like RNA helicase
MRSDGDEGDILVFLTGQDDIDSASQTIGHLIGLLPPGGTDVQVLQFMASTPPAQQAKVFVPSPRGSRKVILATNVAETSITVPGVTVVVDAGFAKEKGYVSRRGSGIETLLVSRISRSAAQQRTGRAGREVRR